MPGIEPMPLQDVLQALSRTPVKQPELRAVLAVTCARWELERGEVAEATAHLSHALEVVPDLRPAMRLLYRIHATRGDIRNAVMYLDQEIRTTRHPREAAALYRERGQLVETHFHDLGAAQQCYQAALKATPRDLAVLRSVERVSLARGDVFSLITNLEAQLDVLRDSGATAGVLRDLALLETRRAGDLSLACDLLLAALELGPSHVGLVSDLARMAELSGDTELLLHALELDAETRTAHARALPLARASLVLREHKERGAALVLLRTAAHAQPDNLSLWRNLEELSLATNRYDTALEACVGQLRTMATEEAATRAEVYYRLGKLALFRLDRTSDGLMAMRKVLRLFPGHIPALEDTGRYLIANQMWAQLLELLKLQITSAKDIGAPPEELAQAYLRAGQVLEEHLGEPDSARAAYQDAISIHPNYRPALDRLERVLHQLGRTDDLREFYRHELERAVTPSRRVFLLSLLGQLHATQEDSSDAIKYLATLLKSVPEHIASLQLLARLLARAGRSRDVLRVTEQEIRITLSPVRKAKLQHRAGELALQLDERGSALTFFRAALDSVDDHQPSIETLERMLREDQGDADLLELLRKRLLYANDRARQVVLRLEIASLLARMGKKSDALAELEQLLARWPRHLPALHAAESLATALGRYDLVVTLLEQHIATVTGPRTRALLLHRAANVRSARLNDDEAAMRDLVRALELWPQLGVARALLLRLYERLGRSHQLQAFAEAGLTSERGADDRRAMALQLAELTPKPIAAIQYLGAVAEAHPEDIITQRRLARACRQARRPSREAGALAAVIREFAQQLAPEDPALLATIYRAARSEEAAGNLDAADQGFARLLDARPTHILARQGRSRVTERKREAALARSARDLEAAASSATSLAQRASYLTIAGELHERRRDFAGALERIDLALRAYPGYLPAMHARARVLERFGEPQHIVAALRTLEELAGTVREPANKVRALCRAGTLALKIGVPSTPNERPWLLFSRALSLDPICDAAFRGLQRTRDIHGLHGAPTLEGILKRRLIGLREITALTPIVLREIAHLGADTDGPACAVHLLEAGLDVAMHDAGAHSDLARACARLGRWSDVVRELETALTLEPSPEHAAALHYFAADAHERADNSTRAVEHYLAAARADFYPKHALLAADRIAAHVGALEQRVEALQLLIELGDGPERSRSLRALAELHRGPLGRPDVAVELMRELLLLRPTDVDVLHELHRLLTKLQRDGEATATLLAGIAHQRAWLRSQGVRADTGSANAAPVKALLRLFDTLGDGNGVYMCTAILETIAPTELPRGRSCDALLAEPWPLPAAQPGRPFDMLIGDLPCPAALELLREGVPYLGEVPGAPAPTLDVSPKKSLPATSGAVIVTRALAAAVSVPLPLVFVDSKAPDMSVVAYLGRTASLIIGKKINATPFSALARDRIGRALFRLATGGEYLHRDATDAVLQGLLLGMCRGGGRSIGARMPGDGRVATAVEQALSKVRDSGDFADAARGMAETLPGLDISLLRASFRMAEDRAGAVCSADPHPALEEIARDEGFTSTRSTMLVSYLVSDEHLALRRTLGYHLESAPDVVDVEGLPV